MAQAINPGIWTYVEYECDLGEETVIHNVDNVDLKTTKVKRSVALKIEELSYMTIRLIPNADKAVIDIRKLKDYCLDLNHKVGKYKARLFLSIFGIGTNDAERLKEIMLQVITTHQASIGRKDKFGQRYTLDFTLTWNDKRATVRSG